MVTTGYVSIELILERVYQNHPFSDYEVSYSEALDWVGSALKLYGIPQYYIDKVCDVTIENYQGELPDNMLYIELLRNGYDQAIMKYTGDPFFAKLHCEDSPNLNCINCEGVATYRINDNYIFTSFEEGTINLAYKAIPLDENGFPQIPNNENLLRALEWEIAAKIAYKLKLTDKLSSENYKIIMQNKAFYKANAISEHKIPDINRMEYWLHSLRLRLLPKINNHSNSFKYTSEKLISHTTNRFDQGIQ